MLGSGACAPRATTTSVPERGAPGRRILSGGYPPLPGNVRFRHTIPPPDSAAARPCRRTAPSARRGPWQLRTPPVLNSGRANRNREPVRCGRI